MLSSIETVLILISVIRVVFRIRLLLTDRQYCILDSERSDEKCIRLTMPCVEVFRMPVNHFIYQKKVDHLSDHRL